MDSNTTSLISKVPHNTELNIVKLKKKSIKVYKNPVTNKKRILRHHAPSHKQWYDSVYLYNVNNIKWLPSRNNYIFSFLTSYFNMYNTNLDKSIKLKRKRKALRRLSTVRSYISKPELKHTNDSIIMDIYLYNRKYFLLKRILKDYIPMWLYNNHRRKKNINIKILKAFNKSITILKKYTTKLSRRRKYNIKNMLLSGPLKKLNIYFSIKKNILLNKNKLTSKYLKYVIDLLNKYYKKKVQLNIINLKYYYLNSDIFSQILANKMRMKKFRGKFFKLIKKGIKKIVVPDNYKEKKYLDKGFIKQNLICVPAPNATLSRQIFDIFKPNQLSNDTIKNKSKNKTEENNGYSDADKRIFSSIKYKSVNGIRVQVSGRLSKRFKAQRSSTIIRHKGTLKSIESFINRYPSSFVRADHKSNVQSTCISSKTATGSFGLKGWISSY